MLNPEVTAFIDKITEPWKGEACTRCRDIIQKSIPDVAERIQYGKPHFLKNGKYACVLGPAKGWVSLTIFNAGALEVPDGLFEAGEPSAWIQSFTQI